MPHDDEIFTTLTNILEGFQIDAECAENMDSKYWRMLGHLAEVKITRELKTEIVEFLWRKEVKSKSNINQLKGQELNHYDDPTGF